MTPRPTPEEGTVERWAWDYLHAPRLAEKLEPPPPPPAWERAAPVRRVERPSRPAPLRLITRAAKSPGPDALRAPAKRAQLLHAFLHHELQATELMAWAVLAFPDAPRAFRRGLVAIALDEIRHMQLYQGHLATLGFAFGDFPVRDWFWERVPSCPSPAAFVATIGMGLEGANLDHAEVFAALLERAGDAEAARLQRLVGAEEIAHVRFARRWFKRLAGDDDFARWRDHLPPPWSPIVMRRLPLNRSARSEAGMSAPFLDALETYAKQD